MDNKAAGRPKVKRVSGGYRVTLPPLPETCHDCGRELDGRVLDNPYGSWAIPTTDGATGLTRCGYCDEKRRGFDPKSRLTPGCKALEYLDRWLEKEAK